MDPEKEWARRIGRRIAEARRNKGLSQAELAAVLGVSFQAVSRWERGESMPEIHRLLPLAGALEVSLEELLKETEE